MCGMTLLRVMMLQHWPMATHLQKAVTRRVANHRLAREEDSVRILSRVAFLSNRHGELEIVETFLEKVWRFEGRLRGFRRVGFCNESRVCS
jgi:hypothetical protein